MLNLYARFLLAFVITLGGFGTASALIIKDTYWGSEDHGWGDRIGNSSYEVYNMDVAISGGYLNVRVNTNFDESTDAYGVEFGDLFISNNGWTPYGTAPYLSDNALTGETWEFVFDTDKEMLYGDEFSILQSDDIPAISGYTFRNGQEVQRDTGGIALAGSSVDLSQVGTGGYLEYNISLSSLGVISGDIGLKWGMTCANDTIEGAVPVSVPEPGTLLLFCLGLLGMVRTVRKS